MNKTTAPYGRWKCVICNLICRTRSELQQHRKIFHSCQAKCPYCNLVFDNCKNLGGHIVSCKLNPRIEQISKSRSQKLSKIIHIHSKETREKLSEIRSAYLDKSTAGFQDVKWYKVKNLEGKEFTVRGHWEENVAKRLNELGILWTKNIWLKYKKDGLMKTYNPDFYLPKTDEYVEVKGYFSDKDKIKMDLVVKQNFGVRIYFINSMRISTFIENGNLSDDMIYKISDS